MKVIYRDAVRFSPLALDQIVNNAATIRHMLGGQSRVPLVMRPAPNARWPLNTRAVSKAGPHRYLSADPRVTEGHHGRLFLGAIDRRLHRT